MSRDRANDGEKRKPSRRRIWEDNWQSMATTEKSARFSINARRICLILPGMRTGLRRGRKERELGKLLEMTYFAT